MNDIRNIEMLPLNGTQMGIWLADQVAAGAQASSGYVIAHCVELDGAVDGQVLLDAIRIGLAGADTVMAQYRTGNAGPEQRIPRFATPDDVPAPALHDWRAYADGKARALAAMRADIDAGLSVDGDAPLCRHALYRVAEGWLWYQRYHHIMLDGFSFVALTRHIAAVHTALVRGAAVPPAPFTPVATAVAEYAAYGTSPQCAADRDFWRGYVAVGRALG
jgi:hypothetical protein